MRTISVVGTEWYEAQVTATAEDGVPIDPSSDVTGFAFLRVGIGSGTPRPTAGTVWNPGAAWVVLSNPTIYVARILIGPAGSLQLAPGDYAVWLKITDAPEIPALSLGRLAIV